VTRPTVFLIGAGPGDAGLMTARGLECLRRADVVLYDHEVAALLLREARPDAELIDVGSAGPTPMAQEAICYLIAEKAQEGKVVARLKWGDPFVFDRGGEEALFLIEQGLHLEIVSGVPIAIAATAYAGIPLTYPGAGDTVILLRGMDETRKAMPDVDWRAIAALDGTLISFASAYQLPRIVDSLLGGGALPETPAAIVRHGTLPSQEVTSGTLAGLATDLQARPHGDPGLLVVGRVAAFRDHLRWFDRRPLFGRRVAITRPREQAGELVSRLTALGAETIEAAMIRILPPEDDSTLRRAVAAAGAFDWIVFSSANAVDAFMRVLLDEGLDARALKGPRLCAVGPATADKLAGYHLRVDLVPKAFRAEAAFDALREAGPLQGARVLLPRADIGREVLAESLRHAGADVTEVIAYRTVLHEGQRDRDPDIYRMLLDGTIDVVTFTSGSAIRNFARVYGVEQSVDLLRLTAVAVIGPTTADVAQEFGIPVAIQPEAATIPALVDAIAAHVAATTER